MPLEGEAAHAYPPGFRQGCGADLEVTRQEVAGKTKTAPRAAANVGVRASQLSLSFVIESWAACAPGVDTPQRWSQWAAAPWLPEGEPPGALAGGAGIVWRCLARLGR